MISNNLRFIKQEKPNTNSRYIIQECIQAEAWMQVLELIKL